VHVNSDKQKSVKRKKHITDFPHIQNMCAYTINSATTRIAHVRKVYLYV